MGCVLDKADGQGKAASMGDVSGQAPAFGHVKEAASGIEGLEVSFGRF